MNESVADATVDALRAFTHALTTRALLPIHLTADTGDGTGDGLARISAMEDLRAALAAAQAAEVAAFAADRRAAVERDSATVRRPGVGVARRREEAARRTVAEVAAARRVSPWQASRFVAFAEQAPTDLPLTFHLLATGRLSERRAALVLGATNPLSPEQRRRVDTELAPDVAGWGDREVDRRARAVAYLIDPSGTVERHARAVADRRVSVRPAPECMAWVTTLCAMPDAVALRAGLERDATAAVAAGEPRTHGPTASDLVVERVTGRAPGRPQPVVVQLVMTDRTLAGTGDDPARFADGEPVPAPLARDWALGRADRPADGAARSVRRVFTDPTGRLVAAETHTRAFTPAMADLIRLRDGTCATPWCDAPIRHVDHVDPHARGGATSLANGRGTCAWCNLAKSDRPLLAPRVADPPERPHRSPLERRTRSVLRRAGRRARRRPVLEGHLPAHRPGRARPTTQEVAWSTAPSGAD